MTVDACCCAAPLRPDVAAVGWTAGARLHFVVERNVSAAADETGQDRRRVRPTADRCGEMSDTGAPPTTDDDQAAIDRYVNRARMRIAERETHRRHEGTEETSRP